MVSHLSRQSRERREYAAERAAGKEQTRNLLRARPPAAGTLIRDS